MANLRPLFLQSDLPIQQRIDIPLLFLYTGWLRTGFPAIVLFRNILVSILPQLIINQPSSINYIHLNLHIIIIVDGLNIHLNPHKTLLIKSLVNNPP